MPTFNPPPTKEHVVQLHQQLIAYDRAYAQQPTSDTHHAILRAQRAYYAALSSYNKHHISNYYVRTLKRAKYIMVRAQMNQKREKHNAHWQDIGIHQYRRANHIRMRANALYDAEVPPPPRKKRRPEEMPVRTQTRIKHPVTGRYIYVDNP